MGYLARFALGFGMRGSLYWTILDPLVCRAIIGGYRLCRIIFEKSKVGKCLFENIRGLWYLEEFCGDECLKSSGYLPGYMLMREHFMELVCVAHHC